MKEQEQRYSESVVVQSSVYLSSVSDLFGTRRIIAKPKLLPIGETYEQ